MFFSLVVVSLLFVSGRAASDPDPDNHEGEDEMEFAVVSLNFTFLEKHYRDMNSNEHVSKIPVYFYC